MFRKSWFWKEKSADDQKAFKITQHAEYKNFEQATFANFAAVLKTKKDWLSYELYAYRRFTEKNQI